MADRVAITGMGVCCAIGRNVPEFAEGLRSGRNGFSTVRSVDTTGCRTNRGAEVAMPAMSGDTEGKASSLARKATQEALEQAHFDPRGRDVALVLGTSLGDFEYLEGTLKRCRETDRIEEPSDAETWQRGCIGVVAANLIRAFELNGPSYSVSTACTAGANAIGYGFELVSAGACEAAIVGGVDALQSISFTGFSALMSLSETDLRPFDEDRDGLLLGEGAGMLILETESHALHRGARPLAEVTGCALIDNAYHVTSPDPDGEGAARGMRIAMEQARRSPQEVDLVNSHGTGTRANDISEYRAIARIFDSRQPMVTANKSQFGHCLGAAGSIEAISTVISLTQGIVARILGTSSPVREKKFGDVDFVLDEARHSRIDFALSNSFAFAGNIAVLGFAGYRP